MDELKVKNEEGKEITVKSLGTFRVEELGKEFVMYSLNDDKPETELGAILLGELIQDDDGNYQVVGILDSEREMVLAFYNEISTQIGGNGNEDGR
jgi:uncharacterized protein YrzB (UPF0473 family)